jgi:hypothetical protein
VLKQFLSEDPIGIADGNNLRTYVTGNPISYTDPNGLFLQFLGVFWAPVAEAIALAGTAVGSVVSSVATINFFAQKEANRCLEALVRNQFSYCQSVNWADPACKDFSQNYTRWRQGGGGMLVLGAQLPGTIQDIYSPTWPLKKAQQGGQ